MTVALGASAYAAGIFHLGTHAFFKAVLFLGAGSVIIALHHEQDMRRMGGLRKYMPITYATMLIAAISSAGIPGFAGFFSKESIIEAARLSTLPGSDFAYFCVLVTVFITALYTFRLIFMTFHGPERFRDPVADPHGHGAYAAAAGQTAHVPDAHGHDHHGHAPHETPAVVTGPLIALAIPSIAAGWVIGPVLFGGYFGDSIAVRPEHDVLGAMAREFHGVIGMMTHAVTTLPFILAIAGIATAVLFYLVKPDLAGLVKRRLSLIYTILDRKYGFDELYSFLFAGGARAVGTGLWKGGDEGVIDGVFVNGSARAIGWIASIIRYFQSGYIYHYAFTMIIGILVLLLMMFGITPLLAIVM
jgi:NADH-quinone oxidoreductase subunit L